MIKSDDPNSYIDPYVEQKIVFKIDASNKQHIKSILWKSAGDQLIIRLNETLKIYELNEDSNLFEEELYSIDIELDDSEQERNICYMSIEFNQDESVVFVAAGLTHLLAINIDDQDGEKSIYTPQPDTLLKAFQPLNSQNQIICSLEGQDNLPS